mmetsp:Transcript_5550/g.20964  ORF Transcript_5550/g.20964 Transcript_5550/m.20964 type:complete len:276 (-) Transcript_5550:208-1035(-)
MSQTCSWRSLSQARSLSSADPDSAPVVQKINLANVGETLSPSVAAQLQRWTLQRTRLSIFGASVTSNLGGSSPRKGLSQALGTPRTAEFASVFDGRPPGPDFRVDSASASASPPGGAFDNCWMEPGSSSSASGAEPAGAPSRRVWPARGVRDAGVVPQLGGVHASAWTGLPLPPMPPPFTGGAGDVAAGSSDLQRAVPRGFSPNVRQDASPPSQAASPELDLSPGMAQERPQQHDRDEELGFSPFGLPPFARVVRREASTARPKLLFIPGAGISS